MKFLKTFGQVVLTTKAAKDQSALLIVTIISLIGFLWGIKIRRLGLPEATLGSMFNYLFFQYEVWMCLLVVGLTFGSLFFLKWFKDSFDSGAVGSWSFGWRHVIVLSILVAGVTWWGAHFVYLGFPLSMDEFAARFQAEIFAKGLIQETLPPQLRPYYGAITPLFTYYHPAQGTIMGAYLPVHALILSGFIWLGDGLILGALFTAASILLLYSIVRTWMPAQKQMATWAVLLMVTSSQILINGMTYYAMPSHLFFNLLWLWLYTRSDKRCFLLLPWIGALAVGLHQPFCHLLFVSPFMLRLALRKEWIKVAYAGLIYSAAIGFWLGWTLVMSPSGTSDVARSLFMLPHSQQFAIQFMNLCIFINWIPFVVVPLLIIVLSRSRETDTFASDLLAGVFLTVIFYFFFRYNQGHGWGYRYIYPVLGNIFILAALGLHLADKTVIWKKITVAALLFSLLVQFPARCYEVKKIAGMFKQPYEKIISMDADFVVMDVSTSWYAQDLVRNKPDFSNKPLLMFGERISAEQLEQLSRTGRIIHMDVHGLEDIGLKPVHEK